MVDNLLNRGTGAVGAMFERVMGAGFDAPDAPNFGPGVQVNPDFGPGVQLAGNPFGNTPIQVNPSFGPGVQVAANPFDRGGVQLESDPFGTGGGVGIGNVSFGPGPQVSGNPFQAPYTPPPAAPIGAGTPGTSGGTGVSPGANGAQGSWGNHEPYRAIIEKYAREFGLDPDAVAAYLRIETPSGDPNLTSHAGAMGLAQVMPFHFGPGENPYDPETNLRVGIRYFASMYKQFGDYGLAAAAYHGGPGAIRNGAPRTDNSDGNMTSAQYAEAWRKFYADIKATAPPTPTGGTGGSPIANPTALEQSAKPLIGNPYQLGGRRANGGKVGPGIGIDCSEFTAYLYEQQGITLRWNAQNQHDDTQRVAKGQWQAGDLIFFHSTYDAGTPVTHVGMFVGYDAQGNPMMLHSGSNGVEYANLNSKYYVDHYYGAGRVVR